MAQTVVSAPLASIRFYSRTRRHMWVEFGGSRPCSEGFLRVLLFSSLYKFQVYQYRSRGMCTRVSACALLSLDTSALNEFLENSLVLRW